MQKTPRKKTPLNIGQPFHPPPIAEGDTIGLFAPAGSLLSKKNFTAGIKLLEKKGFHVKFDPGLLKSKGYLAGKDEERAENFNSLYADPEVKALVAARGGYGSMRMVDLIDMKLISKHPKIIVGFSDLTVLLNTIQKKTGLITFHGPVVTTLANTDRNSITRFFHTLSGRGPETIKPSGIKVLKGGKAEGLLMGGNLTTLAHMIGTPYEIPWDGIILFLEDTGESAYRLDRLLTHLYKANCLHDIKGLILGTFTDEGGKEAASLRKVVHERVNELLRDIDIPIWANFPIGHSRRNLTMPLGAGVKIDSATETITVLKKTFPHDLQ